MKLKSDVIFIVMCTIVKYVSGQCYVNIDDIPTKYEPLYFKNGLLHKPERFQTFENQNEIIALKWNTSESGTLLCSGKGNFINNWNQDQLQVICAVDKRLIEKETQIEVNLKDTSCNKSIPIKVNQDMNKRCDFGNIIDIGFEHENNFYKFIEICYDYSIASTKYSKHIIEGNSINKCKDTFQRPAFSRTGLPYFASEGEPYKIENQTARFSNIVQDKNPELNAFNSISFLARGHLTPVGDTVFTNFKRATMYYVNAAPEWQDINNGNWKRVEFITRNIAIKLSDNLEVVTGVAGILQMTNKMTMQNEKLYLRTIENRNESKRRRIGTSVPRETQDEIIPVPKYFWKVLKYKNESIAFITLNNPYQIKDDVPCSDDICLKNGYDVENFRDFSRGRTYCCEVKDLLNIFPNDVPVELRQLSGNVIKYNAKDQTILCR